MPQSLVMGVESMHAVVLTTARFTPRYSQLVLLCKGLRGHRCPGEGTSTSTSAGHELTRLSGTPREYRQSLGHGALL